ncbi:hypothetical protein FUA48_06050 [Flavobacterium alkalisoli]|uniref:Restriction endonuclease n=1 Tax=Flavobacterium alkalisoli TaxID=2602769 RepID=A0A5B9FSP7_9FLAO|nr:hypothetical protein [Flavobacterium alkalisoli]QEE49156.1 hypothetical protein FUA48_06050 [Flavobacterium alkalisoli]
MELFEEITRQSIDPALYNENIYNYYNNSAREDIGRIRTILNKWFAELPDEEKRELKERFKKDFDSAFHELSLYTLFKKLGYNVTIHPNIEETSKRPDFLITKHDFEAYVEAKVVKDKSHKQEALERKANQFYDSLSKVKIKNFFLGIDKLSFKSNIQPSTKKLLKQIEIESLNFDPEIVTTIITNKGYKYIPKIEYEDKDIHIILKLLPVIPEKRNEFIEHPIGVLPIETWWGGSEESLRDAISEKAKRYGKLEKPYIIAVNALTEKVTSTTDVNQAVLGSAAYTWSTNPKNRDEKYERLRDGVFLDKNGARLTNLTALLIMKIYPHNIPVAPYWLFEHPFSKNKAPLNKLGLLYDSMIDGKFIGRQYNNLGEIYDISTDWLNTK